MTLNVISRATLVVVIVASAMLSACGPVEEVCQATPERLIVVPFTSVSDLETAQEMTPTVLEQLADRGAERCSSVGGGVATDRVESDLAIPMTKLTPKRETAPNREPHLRHMRREAKKALVALVQRPLDEAKATSGSPVLGVLARVAAEQPGEAVVVLVGDAIAVESAPSRRKIDFRSQDVDLDAVREYLPLLRPLAGSCVAVVGAGARSRLDAEVLRRSREILRATLAQVGISFHATRSNQLPAGCEAG